MIGDVYRCEFQGRYEGQNIINTFAYRCTSAPDRGLRPNQNEQTAWTDYRELVTLWSLFTDTLAAPISDCSVVDMHYNTARVFRFTGDIERRESYSGPVELTGTQANPGLPSGVSGVILRRHAASGTRRYRGHLSIAGIKATHTIAGTMDNASATYAKMVILAALMKRPLEIRVWQNESLTFIPVIGNVRRLPLPGVFPRVRPMNDTRIRNSLGAQRSRLPGHGRSG